MTSKRWIVAGTLCIFILSCGTSGSIRIGSHFKKSAADPWGVIGGNERRDHASKVALNPPLRLVWENKISSAPAAHLLVSDDVVYASSLDNRLYAFTLDKGHRIGSLKFLFASKNGLSIDHQTAYIGLGWGKVPFYGYNLFDAEYRYKLAAPISETNPLPYDDYLYIGGLNGRFYALNPADGSTLWTFDASKPIRSSPAVLGSQVFFGCDDGQVYCLNRFNGTLIWKFQTGAAVYATPAIDDKNLYVGSSGGKFYALEASTGRALWNLVIGDTVPGRFYGSAALSEECVFVGGTDGRVYALSKDSGRLRWYFQTGGAISVAPLVTPGVLYVGSQEGTLYGLDLATGQSVWEFKTAGRIKTELAAFGKYLVVASERKNIYVFTSENP